MQIGLAALVLLFLYAVVNPTSAFTIFFVATLLGIVAYLLFTTTKNGVAEVKHAKEKSARIERAQYTYASNRVDYLTPTEFEHYVAAILEKLGYKTIVTPPQNDAGIDVIINRNDVTTGVQVKKWKGNVGRPDLQRLVGAGRQYDRIMCVTNSSFSKLAREYAATHNIRLVPGEQLEKLAEQAFGKDHVFKALSMKITGQLQPSNYSPSQ